MVYYLVDTENIGHQWDQIIPSLQQNDIILLFYTESNSTQTVPFSTLGQMTAAKASFKAIHCVKGTNALDFQLVTYLGFLIAKANKKDNFIICSNDNGYDAAISFWKNRGYNISRKLPEGLIRISRKLFHNCSQLESVVIPSSIRSIDEQAFAEIISERIARALENRKGIVYTIPFFFC